MTGTPSPTPLAEPSSPTGEMHPVLRDCLAAGRHFEEELKTPEGQALLARFKAKCAGDSPPSPASAKPQD